MSGSQLCQNSDLRLPASSAEEKSFSVVKAAPAMAFCSGGPS